MSTSPHHLTQASQIRPLFTDHHVPYVIHRVLVRRFKDGVFLRINAQREFVFTTQDLYFEFVLELIQNGHHFPTCKAFLDGVGVILEMFKVAEQREVGLARTFRDLKENGRYVAKTTGHSKRPVRTYFCVLRSQMVEYYQVTGLPPVATTLTAEDPIVRAQVKDGIARFCWESSCDFNQIAIRYPELTFENVGCTILTDLGGKRGSSHWRETFVHHLEFEAIFDPTAISPDHEINATEIQFHISPEFVLYVSGHHDGTPFDPAYTERLGIGKSMHELLLLISKCTGKCLNVKTKANT